MSTALQLRRGTQRQNDGFMGSEGEITIDTDTWTIRVHDGSTRGGHQIGTQGARVTSVNLDATALGFTTKFGPITTNGTLVLQGILNVASGGTGTSQPKIIAKNPLSVTGAWPNHTISLAGVVPIINGGTGTDNPGLIPGTGINITGNWPNQVISSNFSVGAGKNISIDSANVIDFTGILDVASGGTGTNNPNLTGDNVIFVSGAWPNQTIQLQGLVPVNKGGTGTTNPALIANDTNITVSGDWPNNRIGLAQTIAVNSIRSATNNKSIPGITLDAQSNTITLTADVIKFTYGTSQVSDFFTNTSGVELPNVTLAYAKDENSAFPSPTGMGVYNQIYYNNPTYDFYNKWNAGRYTPPKAGYYRVEATVRLIQNIPNVQQNVVLAVRVNNIEQASIAEPVNSLSAGIYVKSISISAVVKCDGVADFIDVAFSTDITMIKYLPGSTSTFCSITRIN